MRFKVLYILFVISSLLYSNLHLPFGVTPRHIMTILMFLVCLFEDRHLFMDKWFGIYLIFIAGFAISSAWTGYLGNFLWYLAGFYFVAYVGYWASHILLKKYDGAKTVVTLLVIIGMIDASVTIGQFFNVSYLTDISSMLLLNIDTEFLDAINEGEEAYGFSLPGILLSDVYNGYFLLVIGILCLYYLKDGIRLLKLIPWFISIITSYMIQQRSAFYILLLISIFVFFKFMLSDRSRFKWLYMVALVLFLPFAIESLRVFLLEGQSRFSIGMDSTNRDVIYRKSFDFIQENFIWGGRFKMRASGAAAAHNLFLNAWIYGGLIGVFVIIWLFVKQCISAFKVFFQKVNNQRVFSFVFGMAFMGFTLNSMLHNASVVSGDFLIWILWGCFAASLQRESVCK